MTWIRNRCGCGVDLGGGRTITRTIFGYKTYVDWKDMDTFVTGKRIESVFPDFKTFLPIWKNKKRGSILFV
jgi:hypothetical protein